jgi:hypothetical protein
LDHNQARRLLRIGKVMAKTITVDLRGAADTTGYFATLIAEWWDTNSKFAVVRGSLDGNEKFALRLDLDKRAFLDHATSPLLDAIIQKHAHLLSQVIVSEKSKRQNIHAA